jgi:heme/copper-type cytochrome/quinol oxidase subunit 2
MSPSELTEAFFGELNGKEIIGETSFDSYLLPEDELNSSNALTNLRLLTVDNHIMIPTEINTRLTVTSADVIHS